MEADIDVNEYPLAAPELSVENVSEYSLDPGLWNAKRTTGWCEVSRSIVEVNDGGRIALMISERFQRR